MKKFRSTGGLFWELHAARQRSEEVYFSLYPKYKLKMYPLMALGSTGIMQGQFHLNFILAPKHSDYEEVW